MKNFGMQFIKTSFIALILFTLIQCSKQDDEIENTNISSQSELDIFCKSHSKSYEGILHIYGKEITNIEILKDFSELGELRILNTSIVNLKGLENLKSINKSLYISNNPRLKQIYALDKLITIGENISLISNDSLKEITCFKNINTLKGYINISSNKQLENIVSFNDLEQIEESLCINNNDSLKLINAFTSLDSIKSSFKFINNKKTDNLICFNSLLSIGGDFSFNKNENIAEINTFPKVNQIKGKLEIIGNKNLVNFCSISNLILLFEERPEKLSIKDNKINPSIEDIKNGICNSNEQ